MKKILFFTFLCSLNSFAENFRAPAVMPDTCNLDKIATTYVIRVDGKDIIQERPLVDIQRDQCKEVKSCMNSAPDEKMDEYKSIETVACATIMKSVTTKTPGLPVGKDFDGKRNAKPSEEESSSTKNPETPKAVTR